MPSLLNIVHTLIEEKGTLFALTGSSSRKLKRDESNLLAGRAFRFELYPFTHEELGETFSLEDALAWGTLPRLNSLTTPEDKALFLDGYVETYLKEEIVAEQIVRKVVPFRRFLDVAAQMNAKLLNFSSISRDIGVSVDTVQKYFSVLEDTHLGFLVQPYHTSIRRRQRAAPKFYLFDRGATRALERLPGVPVTPQTSSYGEAFEHFIFLELYRIAQYRRRRYTFSYIRTQSNAEIDLIIERPGAAPALVEIKSSKMIHEEDIRQLAGFKKDFKKSDLFCLSRDPISKRIGGVECLPWKDGIRDIIS